MQHEADRDIRSTVVRAAGALVGLAIVLAIIAPFDGVPPRPGTDELAPAKIEVSVLAAGEFSLDPVGPALAETPLPPPGERGGPTLKVKVGNMSPIPLRISVRLTPISPTLSDAVKVRSSVAGTVVVNGPLSGAVDWSRTSGVLRPGQTTTLRMRFKLLDLPPSDWRGRVDVRQLEFKSFRADGSPTGQPVTTTTTSPGASTPTTPSQTTPARTTPTPQSGPPLPGTDTVMGAVMESATAQSDQNPAGGFPPAASTPTRTTP